MVSRRLQFLLFRIYIRVVRNWGVRRYANIFFEFKCLVEAACSCAVVSIRFQSHAPRVYYLLYSLVCGIFSSRYSPVICLRRSFKCKFLCHYRKYNVMTLHYLLRSEHSSSWLYSRMFLFAYRFLLYFFYHFVMFVFIFVL